MRKKRNPKFKVEGKNKKAQLLRNFLRDYCAFHI